MILLLLLLLLLHEQLVKLQQLLQLVWVGGRRRVCQIGWQGDLLGRDVNASSGAVERWRLLRLLLLGGGAGGRADAPGHHERRRGLLALHLHLLGCLLIVGGAGPALGRRGGPRSAGLVHR